MLEHQDFWLEIIKVTPSFLWVILAAVAFFLLYDLCIRHILPLMYADPATAADVALPHFERALADVLKVAEKNPQWHVQVGAEDKERLMRRIRRNRDVLQGSRVLLFDDRPDTLVNEIRMLQQLEIEVETVISVGEGLARLKAASFDLLVSDIARPDGQSNGIATLQSLHDYYPDLPAIFYIGNLNAQDGVPAGAFGITNRPDELLHLVLDILERQPLVISCYRFYGL